MASSDDVKSFEYDSDPSHFRVPAPVLSDILLVNPLLPDLRTQVVGLLDSGADGTIIDPRLVIRLRLAQVDEDLISVATDDGDAEDRSVPVYSVRIVYENILDEVIRISSLPRLAEDDVLIGRDILNNLFLELWGPAKLGYIGLSPRQ